MPSSRGSSQPRDRTHISKSPALAGEFFTTNATWDAPSGRVEPAWIWGVLPAAFSYDSGPLTSPSHEENKSAACWALVTIK